MRASAWVAALSIASFWSGVAAAQDSAVAAQLFDSATELMAQGKLAQACPRFAESQRLDPQLGTLLHLAECLQAQGNIASAWADFKDALEIAKLRGDARETPIRQRLAELEPKVPRLTINVPAALPAGFELKRNGVALGKVVWGVAIPVDPGEHHIEASAAGFSTWSEHIHVEPGMQAALDVPALVASPAALPAPASVAPALEPSGGQGAPMRDGVQPTAAGNVQRILGWSALGAGAIGLVVGVVFQLKSIDKLGSRAEICPTSVNCEVGTQARIDRLTEAARDARLIGNIGLIAGGALAAAGLTLVLTAPRASESPAPSVALALTPQGFVLAGQL